MESLRFGIIKIKTKSPRQKERKLTGEIIGGFSDKQCLKAGLKNAYEFTRWLCGYITVISSFQTSYREQNKVLLYVKYRNMSYQLLSIVKSLRRTVKNVSYSHWRKHLKEENITCVLELSTGRMTSSYGPDHQSPRAPVSSVTTNELSVHPY